MRVINGVIAEVPWVGHIIERADDLPEFERWVRDQRGTVAFDLETCGLGSSHTVPASSGLRSSAHGTQLGLSLSSLVLSSLTLFVARWKRCRS